MSQIEMINTMILFVMAVGIITIIVGLVFVKDHQHPSQDSTTEEQIKVEKKLKDRIEEADEMLQELNEFSSYIQSEIEKKYRELLFLYQIIEERQKQFSGSKLVENKDTLSNIKENEQNEQNEKDIQASIVLNNKNYNDIMKLCKKGNDTASIAKQLKIGTGEVELILGLAKKR